jgi:hypothetical protein
LNVTDALKSNATPGPMIHTGTVKRVFLNKSAQSRLSMDNNSVMSDDGESDE